MKFVKIKEIKQTTTEPIYHINVDKNHNFFGNNLCLHNCDYHNNENNNGNIAVALHNFGKCPRLITKGEKIAQGVFEKYLVADGDETVEERTGGIGSTDK